jgi:hypothetical protein
MDLARAPRHTARKKGSGYENDPCTVHRIIVLVYRLVKSFSTVTGTQREDILLWSGVD